MFKKIDVNLPKIDLGRIKGPLVDDYDGKLISYAIKDMRYLESVIKDYIDIGIQTDNICFIEITECWPHIDKNGVSTSMNWYINPADSITQFWTKKKAANDQGLVANVTKYEKETFDDGVRFWSHDQVDPVCHFCAEKNEIYLLDVTKIHSVSRATGVRQFISWRWDEDFDTVLDSIRIL